MTPEERRWLESERRRLLRQRADVTAALRAVEEQLRECEKTERDSGRIVAVATKT